MNKLNQLQEAIIELVPEIRELKFGCRFTWTDEEMNVEEYEIIHSYGIEDIDGKENGEIQAFATKDIVKSITSFSLYDDEYDQYFHDVAEIIGRDITLADVLFVMRKNGRMWKAISTLIGAYELDDGVGYGDIPMWNLEQNALHLQEQETINFLHDVICQEK